MCPADHIFVGWLNIYLAIIGCLVLGLPDTDIQIPLIRPETGFDQQKHLLYFGFLVAYSRHMGLSVGIGKLLFFKMLTTGQGTLFIGTLRIIHAVVFMICLKSLSLYRRYVDGDGRFFILLLLVVACGIIDCKNCSQHLSLSGYKWHFVVFMGFD